MIILSANKPGNPIASQTSPAVANQSLAALVSQRKERAANTEPTPVLATEIAAPVASPAKEKLGLTPMLKQH